MRYGNSVLQSLRWPSKKSKVSRFLLNFQVLVLSRMLGNITDDENGLTIARRSIAAVIKTVRKIVYKDDRDREEVISSISNDET